MRSVVLCFFFFKQKTAYEMRISDWSSDVCSSDLLWLTRTQYQRNASTKFSQRNPSADASGYWTTKETADIAKTLMCDSTGSKNHQLPLVGAVMFDAQPVAVDPWLLGLLIGDGCLRETSVTLSTAGEWRSEERSVGEGGVS